MFYCNWGSTNPDFELIIYIIAGENILSSVID